MNRCRHAILVPLLAVLALLCGLAGTASAAFNPAAKNPNFREFLLQKSEASASEWLQPADPIRGNGAWIYDSTLGVPAYVRQNPWTSFDPLGLQAWTSFSALPGVAQNNPGFHRAEWKAQHAASAGIIAGGVKLVTGAAMTVGSLIQGKPMADPTAVSQAFGKIDQVISKEFNVDPEFQSSFDFASEGTVLAGVVVAAGRTAGGSNSTGGKSSRTTKAETDAEVEWVNESVSNPRAAAYESGASGALEGKAPRLSATDADGTVTAKFDGVDGTTMIDRKVAVTTFDKSKRQALRQNAVAAENDKTVRWEVPNEKEAARAQRMFDELGTKKIETKVVPEE